MGARAHTAASIEQLITQLQLAVIPGDHIVCMSNGGFGGIHTKLLKALGH
jgi:UDP-N-acetylmuramate: L-alanyl-gamma-D-glutamyl-meso-diaminopimelate ligase